MSAHSEIGPSSADRWIPCPGSVRLSREAPPPKPSKYAAEGTVAHGLIEELSNKAVDELGLIARIGDTVEQDGFDITIDEEMVMHVLEYVREVAEEVAALRADKRPLPVWEHTEIRVNLASVDPDLWGTADKVVFRAGHKLIVRDFKYGKGKRVLPEKNAQLSIYTLATMETIAGEAFDEVEQVISQPRAGGTTRWVVDREWLRGFKEEVRKAIALTRQPDAPLKAGDWCTFCKAKSICPEIAKVTAEETQVDFANAPQPGALMRVEVMPPWKVARVLDHQDLIESWLSAVRGFAQQLLESGQQVPGYKLVDGRSSRKWRDDESAAQRYVAEHGDSVYAPRKVKSVAQMEVLVGKKNLDAALYDVTPGHKKVANDSDPRPSTVSTAQEDFGAAPAPAGVIDTTAETVTDDPLFGPPPTRKGPIWPQ